MTAAPEGGEWSAARPGRTLLPGKNRYPFYRRLGGPQSRSGRAENLVPTRIRSRTVQPVVSCYTDWATRPTTTNSALRKTKRKLLNNSVFFKDKVCTETHSSYTDSEYSWFSSVSPAKLRVSSYLNSGPLLQHHFIIQPRNRHSSV